jgi:hypothetical protein
MSTSASDLSNYAILADACYVNFNLSNLTQEAVKQALILQRSFSQTQASDFSATWEVIHQQPNTTNGFSATLSRISDLLLKQVPMFLRIHHIDGVR